MGAVLGGCDLGTGNSSDPATVVISPRVLQLDAVGATGALTAEVRNAEGTPIEAGTVAWASENVAVARVSPEGIVTAVANGETTITATSGSATGSLTVTVAQLATSLVATSGMGQVGSAGETLAEPLVVKAFDRLGVPARGAPVQFQVLQGGGAVTPAQTTTDATGSASASWTLGPVAGQAQTVRAFLSFRVGEVADFIANGTVGPPAAVVVVGGDGQAGPRLATLGEALVVRVQDAFQNPLPGVDVSFAAEAGSGSVAPASVSTDASGFATAFWTLGSGVGSQSASASVDGLPSAAFTATATEIPDRIEIVSGDGQSGTVGEELAVAPVLRVLDATDAPIADLDVAFSTADGGLLSPVGGGVPTDRLTVRTDASGLAALGRWRLGTVPGTYELNAAVPGLGPAVLTATAMTGPANSLTKFSGDGQTGTAGLPLAEPLVVRVADAFDNPISGMTVTFEPYDGDGSVSPMQAETDADGHAETVWTLGSSTAAQFVSASIPTGASVVFSGGETGAQGLTIELEFLDAPTTAQQEAFDAAVRRWSSVIPGRLTPQPIQLQAGACGPSSPAVSRIVEDVLVFVRLETIDGATGTLGQAGICVVRSGSGLPVVARLTLDVDDVELLAATDRLVDLILHELAHTLGFGTRWEIEGLLQNPSLTFGRGADTYFSGPSAIAAFDAIGGDAYVAGQKVPVENEVGEAGTRDSHWRLSVMTNELMTGYLYPGANPMSRVTIASLADLGYTVDEEGADAFQPLLAPPAPVGAAISEAPLPLGSDVNLGPLFQVDREGRLRRLR